MFLNHINVIPEKSFFPEYPWNVFWSEIFKIKLGINSDQFLGVLNDALDNFERKQLFSIIPYFLLNFYGIYSKNYSEIFENFLKSLSSISVKLFCNSSIIQLFSTINLILDFKKNSIEVFEEKLRKLWKSFSGIERMSVHHSSVESNYCIQKSHTLFQFLGHKLGFCVNFYTHSKYCLQTT